MTFNDGAQVDTSKVTKRSGGKGGMIAGGGVGVALLLFLGSQLLGIDLTPFAPIPEQMISGNSQLEGERSEDLEGCSTGADANDDAECRMAATADSLDQYWATQVKGYRSPADVVLFSGQTQSGCGTASAATGPFYCPTDEEIYIDVAFFDTLTNNYGASSGSLAQMYVLAHEWGHHIQKLIGSMDQGNRGSGATGGSVRLELQADCFAGAWVKDASSTTDATGTPLLEPVTQEQIADAMSAAAAVGDDSIMENAGVDVNPEQFTHGTSEQRQRWFQTGYSEGPAACTTFEVSGSDL